MLWQAAVERPYRGQGVAHALFDDVVRRAVATGVTDMEYTTTSDNLAAIAIIAAIAKRWRTRVDRSPLFDSAHFPDDHQAEEIFHVGPLAPVRASVSS
jgi:L-2,4-diaminobutyric acid acetyltransferase